MLLWSFPFHPPPAVFPSGAMNRPIDFGFSKSSLQLLFLSMDWSLKPIQGHHCA